MAKFDDSVHIKELQLRLPGMSAEEGRRFSAEVLQRVTDRLPENTGTKTISSLDLKVRIPDGTPRHLWVEQVANAILRGCK